MIIPDDQPIIGSPSVGYAACAFGLQVLASKRPADERAELAAACVTVGRLASIGDFFLVVWILKETGNLGSARWIESRNPAGLGATNDGAWGARFNSVAEGVAAMAGHAINYALKPQFHTPPQAALAALDPRREPLARVHGYGSAPRFIDLSQRWAVLPKGIAVPPPTDPMAYGMNIVLRARQFLKLLESTQKR